MNMVITAQVNPWLANAFDAQCPAKLDEYFARLYGLTGDELRYTPFGVDPKISLGRHSAC